MVRNDAIVAWTLALASTVALMSACKSDNTESNVSETNPTCTNGVRDGDEVGVDCGGSCVTACDSNGVNPNEPSAPGTQTSTQSSSGDPGGTPGVKDPTETDVDCGGPNAAKCADGKSCLVDTDCQNAACNYAKKCVSAPSCKPHLGGDTCGLGEVDEAGAVHESCCRTLPVTGYADPSHPGKTVYLDKYEITAGRVRSWIEQLTAASGGQPNVKAWITAHTPQIWDHAWDAFLPTDTEGGTMTITRRLLGDPRPEDEGSTAPPGPGVILPPATDQVRHMGTNYQFGSEVYVDLHGSDCATWSGSYGFPTYYYPPDILARDTQMPRADGITFNGSTIAAKDLNDVKSMNCISNAMLVAFCAWDGGQLATDEVLDYVTATPATLGNTSGCGTQIDDHGELLANILDHTIQTGGRCAPVSLLNATFDAGDDLPVVNSPLNVHNYHYPDLGNVTHDKVWEVGAPGRGSLATAAMGQQTDVVRINPNDEPWMDLNGNLAEAALDMTGATFTGMFAIKYRSVGYGTSRSDLNILPIKGETILRVQRPEAKAGYTGGRCMRFK